MEKIVKTSRLFAEFMGYEPIRYNNTDRLIYSGNKSYRTIGEEKKLWCGLDMEFTGRFVEKATYPFDKDFNYLIPIIKRIEESGYVVAIKGISYQIYKVLDEQNPIISLVCGDLSKKTEMTCELLVSFIELLNKFNQHGTGKH